MSLTLSTTPDAISNIDGPRSQSSYQGSGIASSTLILNSDSLIIGCVSDVFPTKGTCYVACSNTAKNLKCLMASQMYAGIFGCRSMGLPSIGTNVIVYIVNDGSFGYIIGAVPPLDDDSINRPVTLAVANGGVNVYSDTEAWSAATFGATDAPEAGGGITADVLPGEYGISNEFSVMIAWLRLMAIFKAGDLAKIEAFAIDNLLRITGHNLDVFTASGQRHDSGYYGRVSLEEYFAFNLKESLGYTEMGKKADKPSLRKTPKQTSSLEIEKENKRGLWRISRFTGWVGEIFSEFVARPSQDGADGFDGGVLHRDYSKFGRHYTRSLSGGGIHKVDVISVPSKQNNPGDPGCDEVKDDEPEPLKPFKLIKKAGDESMEATLKVADFFAYQFGKEASNNISNLKKDFKLKDEAEIKQLGGDQKPPGIGGNDFFRDFPTQVSISTGGENLISEKEEVPVTPGRAWIDVLPDGSISLKDIWGSTIEMRGGKIIISASKGIDLVSGTNIVALAGDDFIARAKNSIDITSTKKQVRIKAEKDILIHSEKASLQFTAPGKTMDKEFDKKGEEYKGVGILFKSGTGVQVEAETSQFFLSKSFYVTGRITEKDGTEKDKYPEILFEPTKFLSDMQDSGMIIFRDKESETKVVGFIGGSMYINKDIYSEGSAYFNGSIMTQKSVTYGGGQGKMDPDKDPPKFTEWMSDMIKNYPLKEREGPLVYTEMSKLLFTFRSSKEYGATEGRWYQSQWQQELDKDLKEWKEEPLNETYPYPGKKHFEDEQKYYTYEPVNYSVETGKMKKREELSDEGGNPVGKNWNSFKVIQVKNETGED